MLGALDGGELAAQILGQACVELVLVEIRRQVRRVVLVGGLAAVLMSEPGERPLDPLPLGGQELMGAIGFHVVRTLSLRSGTREME